MLLLRGAIAFPLTYAKSDRYGKASLHAATAHLGQCPILEVWRLIFAIAIVLIEQPPLTDVRF
ncbi:MAG TPA: hypothetical protein V6D48_10370 [Oculatellaceae cyanobacterium]